MGEGVQGGGDDTGLWYPGEECGRGHEIVLKGGKAQTQTQTANHW